jgi:hypothetical protein
MNEESILLWLILPLLIFGGLKFWLLISKTSTGDF